jgi:hypothetical protein
VRAAAVGCPCAAMVANEMYIGFRFPFLK